MRRSSFPNYQRVGMLTCSKVPRFHYYYYYYYRTTAFCWHPLGGDLIEFSLSGFFLVSLFLAERNCPRERCSRVEIRQRWLKQERWVFRITYLLRERDRQTDRGSHDRCGCECERRVQDLLFMDVHGGVDGICAEHLTVESYMVFICQQSYLLLFGIPSPTHSFFPGLKPSFSANPSHCSPISST